jgi:hypothetical protein
VPATRTPVRSRAAGLALLLASSLALTACGGGSSPSAAALLKETLSTHRPIASGQLAASLTLAGASGRQPSSLHLAARFQAAASGRLPDFALSLGLNQTARELAVGAVSMQGRLFLALGGAWFLVPAGAAQALARGYAESGAAPTLSGGSALARIGVDAARWLTSPRIAGSVKLAGEDTIEILASVDASRFLADAQRLSQALTSPVGAQLSDPSDPLSLRRISNGPEPRGWTMHVYTGAHDHILRRLAMAVTVLISTPTSGNSSRTRELGTLSFTLAVARPNQPQAIAAPGSTRPLSRLGAALERLGLARGSPPGG